MKGASTPVHGVDVDPPSGVRLPSSDLGPILGLTRRLVISLVLIVFVAMLAYVDRDGYKDAAGNAVTLLDCFYYATVSITTTGYGDVIPVTDQARLVTTLFITPARILFLIILVGTTLEVLAARTRNAYREATWRKRLKNHTIVCGYGTKGKAAIRTLLARGVEARSIVVVDPSAQAVAAANQAGYAGVQGDATQSEILQAAAVDQAEAVIVAPARDDTAVLMTLTARELNPQAVIVAAVREEENAHLLRQSGASSVIVTSSASGRLLGHATHSPQVVEVLEDLLAVGEGLDIIERDVEPRDIGPLRDAQDGAPVLAVIRGKDTLRFDDERAQMLQEGDRLICLCSN
ncbi:MAG: Potassium channel protein [uncultured Solirubrobacteraceae bacterium]|uniref:Potassium channel protein n=1 Tax=uncultured Solirubrobacteraceae bacterium TaxID=1162706 RepID=A0A6J4RLQ7_9ACTN|nr:MAG: Potassium channel protein [uncultured Solirubrobacteraceae bacterium]